MSARVPVVGSRVSTATTFVSNNKEPTKLSQTHCTRIMGYDTKQFESKVSKEFLCPICHDVLRDPLTVPTCEHVFCGQCIEEWFQKNPENSLCPMDRSVKFTLEQLQKPLRSFRNLLNSLNIRCQYENCGHYVQLQEYDEHCKDCIHNPVNQSKEFKCPRDCGAVIRLQDNHDCVKYLKKLHHQAIAEKCKIAEELNKLKDDCLKAQADFLRKTQSYEEQILNLNKENETQRSLSETYCQQLTKLKKTLKCNGGDLDRSSRSSGDSCFESNFTRINQTNDGNETNCDGRVNGIKTELLLDLDNTLDNGTLPARLSTNSNSTFYDDHQQQQQQQQQQHRRSPISPNKPTSNTAATTTNMTSSRSNLSELNLTKRALSFMPNIIPKPKTPNSAKVPPPDSSSLTNELNTAQQQIISQKQSVEEVIQAYGASERVATIVLLFNRRHFYSPNEMHKPSSLGKGAYSFSVLFDIKLLEFIEPYITQESRVLDIGSGHGYLSCCLTQLSRFVVGVEHIRELVQKSRDIVTRHYPGLFEAKQLHFSPGDGRLGYEKYSPYDLILVEPFIKRVPDHLIAQLKPNSGSLVAILKTADRYQLVRITVNERQQQSRQTLLDDHQFLTLNCRNALIDRKAQDNVRAEIRDRIRGFS